MTQLSTNVLLAAGQPLIDNQERAFIAACDTICLIADAADGWPSIRVLEPRAATLEVVNSQALRLQLDQPVAMEGKKIALLLIRHRDGQRLIVHGHVAVESGASEGGRRLRISVASRSWLPELASDADPVIARALSWS